MDKWSAQCRTSAGKFVQRLREKHIEWFSFFHQHPSEIPEDQWSVWSEGDSKILIDKVTFAIMAECQCEFLTRISDAESKEPTIVSVHLCPRPESEEPTGTTDK